MKRSFMFDLIAWLSGRAKLGINMMKERNYVHFNTSACVAAVVLLLLGMLLSACSPLLGKPEKEPDLLPSPVLPAGMGLLSVSLSGPQFQSDTARTMLAVSPGFTRYELVISPDPETGAGSKTYSSSADTFQMTLPAKTYTLSATGFSGDKPTARTVTSTVAVSAGNQTKVSPILKPYMDNDIYGTLHYSLDWDSVGQIPSRAELLIEQYNSNNNTWDAIPISLINGELTAGSQQGTILLLQKDTGLVKQTGSLELPPGEYRLTTSVAMSGPNLPVSRTDIAHIFSNLTTPAAFFYGSGDIIVSDSGSDDPAFITRFTFSQTPSATSIIGSNPGADGTRLIMVMVPLDTDLTRLTPVVECAPGSRIVSPAPRPDPPYWPTGDYSLPTSWTAEGKNGVTQQYTVMVTKAGDSDCSIMDVAFEQVGLVQSPLIDYNAGSITVVVPSGTLSKYPNYTLTPVFSYFGTKITLVNSASDSPLSGPVPLSPDKTFRVYARSGATKDYTLKVSETPAGQNTDADIFDFVITNVPKAKVVIGMKPRADGKIPIVLMVPYRTSPLTTDGSNRTDLQQLIPKITLSSSTSTILPNPNGTTDVIPFGNQNDFQEAVYRVTAEAGNTRDYVVVVARDVQYYYVKATGSDADPDQYNGGSESNPFKTLAFAVYQAVKHDVDHIFVIGTLNDSSESGAYENTSSTTTGNNGTFQSSGAPSVAGGAGVFNLNGSGRAGQAAYQIYISGVGSNAMLQGTNGKRVISISGGARITFDNLTIQGGGNNSYAGSGGGMYIGGDSIVEWKSGNISGSTAVSGGGVYVDNSEFDFMAGSINGNTATGKAATNFTTGNNPSIQGGGGVYVNGENALFWLAEGQITGNSTEGSGGGVLVNGSAVPDRPAANALPHNFIMSAGAVNNNTSKGSTWPHGGGGVFVAKGVFEMLNGQIMNNKSTRQGGGVFVWSRSLFWMGGDSSVTANSGVGSAKAICNRGITTMRDNAQADKVYVWNYAKGSWNNGAGDEFTLMEGARVTGLVLAFADDPQNNRNYINIVSSSGQFFTSGTDPITTIDLESHLTSNGSFAADATIAGDWLNNYLIRNGGSPIPAAQAADVLKRFPLGTFTSGKPSQSLSPYKLDNTGKLVTN
jgi:hypothetical protein